MTLILYNLADEFRTSFRRDLLSAYFSITDVGFNIVSESHPAPNLNIKNNPIPVTDSNLSEVRRGTNQVTFQMIYHQKPISKVLYDISTFFNFKRFDIRPRRSQDLL